MKFILFNLEWFPLIKLLYMSSTELPICETKSDIEKAYGNSCYVIGIYEIKPFRTKKNIIFVHWPVLVLHDNTIILLESFWNNAENKRSPDERNDLVGKKIKAKGVIHKEPPTSTGAQNIAIPCISPVDDIKVFTSR